MNSIYILVVEDERLVADDLRETLEYLGYSISDLVASGEEAIVKAEEKKPNLVLMDIRLEGKMDGIEASIHIQSLFNIPVVYLTANTDQATLERAKFSQPFGYILKPFDEKTLSTTIEIALSRHQAEIDIKNTLAGFKADKNTTEFQIRQKSQYLCMAAHEFRNPLATIKFGTEMLKEYSDISEEKKQKYLQRIETATNNLIDLLEDILTLGRAESGKLAYCPSDFDIVTFCEEILELLEISIGEQYTLKFTVHGDRRLAYLDKHLLSHLLNNLISNAIKYSPVNSTILLILNWEIDFICFQVQDQGIGIPEESYSYLFEPFQRANNVSKIPGTGLGLAIVKQCVDLHGGTIDFISHLGKGTTFFIKLPLIEP
jgi:signal transduction histidine kinase